MHKYTHLSSCSLSDRCLLSALTATPYLMLSWCLLLAVVWFLYATYSELKRLRGQSWIPLCIPFMEGGGETGMWDPEPDTNTFAVYQVRACRCRHTAQLE